MPFTRNKLTQYLEKVKLIVISTLYLALLQEPVVTNRLQNQQIINNNII